MIISKTPLRISFFSGGSDMESFYLRDFGAALSVTIDKYIHVITRLVPHTGIKTMYDKVEECSDINQMQDGITKEVLKYFYIEKDVSIASISDIASKGSGLGSSSAFTVGLLNTLEYLKYEYKFTAKQAAELSYFIEKEKCGYPVGKQDQYAASYGGLNLFEFKKSGKVEVKNQLFTSYVHELQNNLLLVYSGKGRSANKILQKQKEAMSDEKKFKLVANSRDKAYKGLDYILSGDLDKFGELLHEAWIDKKAVTSEISDEYFDDIYNRAINAGSLGGKLLGAGGGGFFIFYVKDKYRKNVINSISQNTLCKVYDFRFSKEGSKIIL